MEPISSKAREGTLQHDEYLIFQPHFQNKFARSNKYVLELTNIRDPFKNVGLLPTYSHLCWAQMPY